MGLPSGRPRWEEVFKAARLGSARLARGALKVGAENREARWQVKGIKQGPYLRVYD